MDLAVYYLWWILIALNLVFIILGLASCGLGRYLVRQRVGGPQVAIDIQQWSHVCLDRWASIPNLYIP